MAALAPRRLDRIVTLPPPAPGHFGPDHLAVEVIAPGNFADTDPFILLMDDRLDGTLRAGPHPHAGFETVSFLVDGEIPSENGTARLAAGDVEWTTAGSGIVHGPSAPFSGRMRLLQLWLTLPHARRWTTPDHQFVTASGALVRNENGVEIRLYSGSTGSRRSPTRNRVPVTLADVRLGPGARVTQSVSRRANAFLYVLEGTVRVGEEGAALTTSQVGWLDRATDDDGEGPLVLAAGDGPARVLLYAGEAQRVPIVSHGPFIGESRDDIVRSYERFRAGRFVRV